MGLYRFTTLLVERALAITVTTPAPLPTVLTPKRSEPLVVLEQ